MKAHKGVVLFPGSTSCLKKTGMLKAWDLDGRSCAAAHAYAWAHRLHPSRQAQLQPLSRQAKLQPLSRQAKLQLSKELI